MIHFSFLATDSIKPENLNDLEARFELQETVVLESFDELVILLKLFGTSIKSVDLPDIDNVENSWVLSQEIKQFEDAEFDHFYQEWLRQTGRDNNMDEYGQLLHLNSFGVTLNQANHKVVLQEAI
ncbi:hypothetical protein [Motilimonas eburnea]|uniref:hypothetical protein n=1 Tax=Motilimonas eburnea TaxID=1737488 RepID=UPI001E5EA051|nr:hypothetical protein [Motilimonas eburnea]MCE2573808.1 hypothetical protein [Motilimonas eburnea]